MGFEVFENYECEGQLEISDCSVNRKLTHLSLFSGIGGLDLAAEWAGFESVGQCEWADYPTKVLEKHWPDVPRWRDIRTLTGDDFYAKTGRRTVDIISGGFPCQPFSVAGKQRGKEDDRYLWPEMVRVIAELRPTWVVGENVAGIVNMALDDVLSDLEREGYATRTFLLPAHAVGAPHQRYRVAIVAHSKSNPAWRLSVRETETFTRLSDYCENVADSYGAGCKKFNFSTVATESEFSCRGVNAGTVCNTAGQGFPNGTGEQMEGQGAQEPESKRSDWWAVEPDVGRVANGVPSRVDRLKCLGNAVVPQQFYPVFKAIADIENR